MVKKEAGSFPLVHKSPTFAFVLVIFGLFISMAFIIQEQGLFSAQPGALQSPIFSELPAPADGSLGDSWSLLFFILGLLAFLTGLVVVLIVLVYKEERKVNVLYQKQVTKEAEDNSVLIKMS